MRNDMEKRPGNSRENASEPALRGQPEKDPGNDLKKSVFSGMFWRFGERITAQLVTLIVETVLARLLMPEAYSAIAIVLVFITFANVFVTSGFGNSLIQKKDADSVDFSDLPYLKFIRGVRDFFSMEHHLEMVSMGVIDPGVMKHIVYSNSDHLVTNFLLHTDVCSLGLNFMYRPYEQYDIKPLAINGCEPFLQIGYVRTPERPLSPQARWLTDRFGEMLQGYELQL